MYIDDIYSLEKLLVELNTMTIEDRETFENSLSFKSLATVYDSLYTNLDNLTTATQEQNFVTNNPKYLISTTDEINSTLNYDYYHMVANRNGIFVIDQTVCRITKNGIIAVDGASISQMSQLTINENFNISSVSGMYYFYEPNNVLTGCGNSKEAYFINGERKVIIDIWTYKISTFYGNCPSQGNSQIRREHFETMVEVRGLKWRFGKWRRYKTFLEFKEVYFELDVPEQTSYNNQTCSSVWHFINGYQTNQSAHTNSDWYNLPVKWSGIPLHMGGEMANIILPNPYFNKVKGKASSRGITNNCWASISCGY
jgi:hypothetical protein